MVSNKTVKFIIICIYTVSINNKYKLSNQIEQNISHLKFNDTNMTTTNAQNFFVKLQGLEKRSLSIATGNENSQLIELNTFGVLIIAATIVASVFGLCLNHKKKLTQLYFKNRNSSQKASNGFQTSIESLKFDESVNKKRNCFPVSVTLPYNVMQLSVNGKLPTTSIVLDIDSSKTSYKYDLPFNKLNSPGAQQNINESHNKMNVLKKKTENKLKSLLSPILVEKLFMKKKLKFNQGCSKAKCSSSLSTISEENVDVNNFPAPFSPS